MATWVPLRLQTRRKAKSLQSAPWAPCGCSPSKQTKTLLGTDEGLCVQCMHIEPYDDEPATINAMRAFAAEQGYVLDFSETSLHHEIYLSDPRKCAPEKLKTVIRNPIKLV